MSALERVPHVALFNGATPDDVTNMAGAVADRFSDIVKRQRMFKRIGDRDHILIEAWQTIGTLTGVFAVDDGRGVREIPWPEIVPWVEDEPPRPGAEPRDRASDAWRDWKAADERRRNFEHNGALGAAYALGKTFGFVAAFRAVKDGKEIGWGEGRVSRSERTWVSRDDYALSSMAQTRGQSRALGAPLRFIVKLAGYEPTLPDEPDEDQPGAAPAGPVLPYGPWASDEEQETGAKLAELIAPAIDGYQFILLMGQFFDGVPKACVDMLRGLARFKSAAEAPPEPTEATTPAEPAEGASEPESAPESAA